MVASSLKKLLLVELVITAAHSFQIRLLFRKTSQIMICLPYLLELKYLVLFWVEIQTLGTC